MIRQWLNRNVRLHPSELLLIKYLAVGTLLCLAGLTTMSALILALEPR